MIRPIKSHHSAWVLRQVSRFLWVQCHRFSSYFALQKLAREQAFRSALASGREKEGELATTSLKFEYLHRKSRCEMLIGGVTSLMTSLPLVSVFPCLPILALVSPSRWLTEISQFSRRGATGDIGGGVYIPETWLQAQVIFRDKTILIGLLLLLLLIIIITIIIILITNVGHLLEKLRNQKRRDGKRKGGER